MRSSLRVLMSSAMISALTGCMSLGHQEPQRYYVLDIRPGKHQQATAFHASTLLVASTTASTFYETQEIVYARAPGERAYYQLHAWTERPALRINELLVMRLQREGSFKTVARAVSGIKGDWLLNTRLVEFYHDAATPPGSVKVTITAELMDPVRRVLLARRVFRESVPAATYDAPGAVRAFDTAVSAILDDIAAWVDNSAPR